MTVKTNNVQKGGKHFYETHKVAIQRYIREGRIEKIRDEYYNCLPDENQITDIRNGKYVKNMDNVYDDFKIAFKYIACMGGCGTNPNKMCLKGTFCETNFGSDCFVKNLDTLLIFDVYQLASYFNSFSNDENKLLENSYNELKEYISWKYRLPMYDDAIDILDYDPYKKPPIKWKDFCFLIYRNNKNKFPEDSNVYFGKIERKIIKIKNYDIYGNIIDNKKSKYDYNDYGGKKSRKSRNKKRKSNKKKRKTVKKRRLRKQK